MLALRLSVNRIGCWWRGSFWAPVAHTVRGADVDTPGMRDEDASVTRPRIVLVALLAVGLGAASQSRGQVPPPPCSSAVAGQPTFSASDLDERLSSRLIATHTIRVTADLSETVVDGRVRFSMPPSATVIGPHGEVNAGPWGLIFFFRKVGSGAGHSQLDTGRRQRRNVHE